MSARGASSPFGRPRTRGRSLSPRSCRSRPASSGSGQRGGHSLVAGRHRTASRAPARTSCSRRGRGSATTGGRLRCVKPPERSSPITTAPCHRPSPPWSACPGSVRTPLAPSPRPRSASRSRRSTSTSGVSSPECSASRRRRLASMQPRMASCPADSRHAGWMRSWTLRRGSARRAHRAAMRARSPSCARLKASSQPSRRGGVRCRSRLRPAGSAVGSWRPSGQCQQGRGSGCPSDSASTMPRRSRRLPGLWIARASWTSGPVPLASGPDSTLTHPFQAVTPSCR
jgi:hypothetical protein